MSTGGFLMATAQTEVQALPFVVEPIAPTRIKLWARFAGQMSSDEDIDIASHVYYGFWYDNHMFQVYNCVLPHVEGIAAGNPLSVSHLVMWLDSLADGLAHVVDTWSRVVRGLLGQAGDVSFPRHYKDADQHVAWAVRVLAEVRQFGVAVCQEFGLVIPESFVEQSTSPTVSAAGEGVESL